MSLELGVVFFSFLFVLVRVGGLGIQYHHA
jgi:hypothetical protein